MDKTPKDWDETKVKCHTCNPCGKFYLDHDFLCSDDICIDCHGGMEGFAECEMRHFFLAATQCFNLTFKTETSTIEVYNAQIEQITKQSMAVVRDIIKTNEKFTVYNKG